jgi:ribosomal protein S11
MSEVKKEVKGKDVESSKTTEALHDFWKIVLSPEAEDLYGIIHINYKKNNIIMTVTDLKGQPKGVISGGQEGSKGFSKKTPLTAQSVAFKSGMLAKQKGFEWIDIRFKGQAFLNKRLGPIVREILKSKLKIRRIQKIDTTPHGGCRLRRSRRM